MTPTPGFIPADIEKAVLSCMMQWEECSAQGAELLTNEHFGDPTYGKVFAELVAFWIKGTPTDLMLFTKHLSDKGLLDNIGGVSGITDIFLAPASAAAMRHYVELLEQWRQSREFVATATEAIREVSDDEEGAIPAAITKLSEIPLRRSDLPTFTQAVADKIDRMEHHNPGADIIKTGLEKLDINSPLRRGDMPLISGERKAGKSILALSICYNVALAGLPVLYFSLEDRIPKVIDRIFAGASRVPMNRHHIGQLTESDMSKCITASSRLSNLPIIIRDDTYDLFAIVAVIRQTIARQHARLVIVDYAQLIRCKAESRREEVELVSRTLRLTAMELNVPIILLCQLNKDGETRETKALEMDATAMWRIDVRQEDKPTERFIVIPWQRNGESGTGFKVAFLGDIARVENLYEHAEQKAA